jgi:hypothetical protein
MYYHTINVLDLYDEHLDVQQHDAGQKRISKVLGKNDQEMQRMLKIELYKQLEDYLDSDQVMIKQEIYSNKGKMSC